MKGMFLSKESVVPFIEHLSSQKILYAPQQRGMGSVAYEKVENADDVVLDYPRALLSIKKYFLPQRETLLRYQLDDNSFEKPKIEPLNAIFFGVHNYDLRAVFKLDYNFSNQNPEKNYLERRKDAIFVGTSYDPDNFHFSQSVGLDPHITDGFDMFLHKTDEGYVLEVVTKIGEELLKGFGTISEFQGEYPKNESFKASLYAPQSKLKEVFANSYDNPIWKEMAEKCVGCGTCNLTCPTCFCFNVEDNVGITLEDGSRDRHLDGCMLRGFTEVAGGEIFRDELAARMRHRIYRKFKYISDITNEPWCVGCGRCTIFCPAGISIVDIVNRLVSDYDKQQVLQEGQMASTLD